MGVYIGTSELKNAYIGERNPFMDYQEVEYIQSSGTQYIDTGFLITPNTTIEADFQFTSTTAQQRIFGIGTDTSSSTSISFCIYINGSGKWARATQDGVGNWQTTNVNANTNRNKFVLSNSDLVIYNSVGTVVYNGANTATITRTAPHSFGLFSRWKIDENSFGRFGSGKLYSCKVTDNNVLQRDFVPCYRKSDNEVGLWDKVNNKFYPNAGTGTFTKGPDVN